AGDRHRCAEMAPGDARLDVRSIATRGRAAARFRTMAARDKGWRWLLLPLTLVAVIGALVLLQRTLSHHGSHAARPWPVSTNPNGSVNFGIVTGPLALNEYRQWGDDGLQSINAVEQRLRKHVRVALWYAGWRQRPNLSQLRAIADRHSVPEITWEPW